MAMYCADWCDLDGFSFRKVQVYGAMKWANMIDFPGSKVSIASHGGPVAIAHIFDEASRPRKTFPITFHTAAGLQMSKIQWKSGPLLHMFWNSCEDFFCVQTDGKVFVYSMFGVEKRELEFSMGQEAQEMKIVEAQSFESSFGTGLAVLTTSNRIYIVNNVNDPKLWRNPELPRKSERPSCWTVICGERSTKILMVVGAEMFLMTQGHAEQIMPVVGTPVKQYVRVAVSYDQTKLAFLSENGLVQITTTDLKHCFCECDSSLRVIPEQFMWCGSEAICIYDKATVNLIGMQGGTLRYAFDEFVFLKSEIDGIRIYSQNFHEFLSKVPSAVRAVYQVASNAPGALLLEASNKYQGKSYQAYDYLRMIEQNLEEAVRQCSEAAAHEDLPESQKALLQAASFGKAFAHDMDSDSFVNTCRNVRVMNATRDRHFGIPITYSQLEELTMPVLIDRLINRSQWPLAIAVCQHLRLSSEEGVNRVLAHWACQKIQEQAAKSGDQRVDTRQLADVICGKFREYPGISYADVAAKAAECGLKELATLLLENEPQLVRQVTMLLKLGKSQRALSKAAESGDPDLIHFVILHLKRTMDKGELDLGLRKFPTAFALYKQYCRQELPEHLKALCRQEDDFAGQALCYLRDASTASIFDVKEKQDCLMRAERCFADGKEDFFAQQLSDQCKLLRYQAEFEEKFGQALVDLSLRETIIWLIEKGENNKADVLRKELKVSEKQFWWWKVEALARVGRWAELETFSKSKKSPIGYVPFVEMAFQHNERKEALKYLSRVPAEDKVRALLKMDMLDEAASSAYEQADDAALNRVLSHCGPQSRGLSEKILQMKQEILASGKKK